ncbi:aminotransferase class V-fold PLP-dependent enzyme [Helicovermis profundi]|uniref:Aminotransferase class V-fold PLP-dependent enzyme n=1 Tax=Helicovermis profundi TaxID=3065157 RepID=A0AAU9ESX1_9FIRM|nr:aminotransferase class V-fold PLP-dependent enzyme [Clostridia bacterium S502]
MKYIDDDEKLRLIRDQMPATKKVYYLNNGTNGPLPKITAEIIQEEARKEYEEGRYLPFLNELYENIDITRKLLSKIMGASYEEIALTQSTTEAINIVLWGLNWLKGDEVITTNIEHTSVLAPLAQIKNRKGITVKYISVNYADEYNEKEFLKNLENMITPRTKLFAVSHVSFATGMKFPIKKIVETCHKYNVQVLVDGAQGAGAALINLHDVGVDYYAIAGRKWLLGPEGIGALYIAKNRISEVDPTFISPSSIKNRHDIDINSPYIIPAPFAARYQIATAMYTPTLLGFQKSLEYFINEIGVKWAINRIEMLAKYVRNLIVDIPGVKIITPAGTEAGFIHFKVDGWKPEDICKVMNEKKFMIRPVPKNHLPAPIRISTGFYVTEEELKLFADELRKVIVG